MIRWRRKKGVEEMKNNQDWEVNTATWCALCIYVRDAFVFVCRSVCAMEELINKKREIVTRNGGTGVAYVKKKMLESM